MPDPQDPSPQPPPSPPPEYNPAGAPEEMPTPPAVGDPGDGRPRDSLTSGWGASPQVFGPVITQAAKPSSTPFA